jgi:hypothetical protein
LQAIRRGPTKLATLMGGQALTAELARDAGVTAQTASGHLARLLGGPPAIFLPGHARPRQSRPPAHTDKLSEEAATYLKP